MIELTDKRAKIYKANGTYDAYFGPHLLGSYDSPLKAQIACEAVATYKKLAKRAEPQEDDAPAVLRPGIYKKGSRYVVRSPRYLGSFPTYKLACAAQDAAPRIYKKASAPQTTPFEARKLVLE